MPDNLTGCEVLLEVVGADRSRRSVRVAESPFCIGRGGGTGNHLQLPDTRISRQAAAILSTGGRYCVEDRGQRGGIYVNGAKIDKCALENGDVISFGLDRVYEITFRSSAADTSVEDLLDRIESISDDSTPRRLGKINLLLEATMLLHSDLPIDSVLASMLDHATALMGADRSLLLEADDSGSLRTRLARGRGGVRLSPEAFAPSQTALRMALERETSVITEDLNQADTDLQAAQSIVAQRLRAIVVIPLYARSRAPMTKSKIPQREQFLGLLYLDSCRAAAFSKLDRQILDAIAVEAASILDNARLVVHERERQRLEQELSIAREIQQALLPCGFLDFPYLAITGTNSPCLAVGGDYFDVFTLSDDRTAFLIADVSGKGLGAALLTTMLQGALSGMKIGAEPAGVFNHINRFFCEHSEVGHYATMFFGILDREGHFEFINAGHPSPLLIRAGEVAEPFTEGGFPLGLIPEATYVPCCAALRPGDTLVLYSDGVTEAADPDEQMFGVSRLREVVLGQHEAPLEVLRKTILESVGAFSRGASQADDITLVLARYRGATLTESHR